MFVNVAHDHSITFLYLAPLFKTEVYYVLPVRLKLEHGMMCEHGH